MAVSRRGIKEREGCGGRPSGRGAAGKGGEIRKREEGRLAV